MFNCLERIKSLKNVKLDKNVKKWTHAATQAMLFEWRVMWWVSVVLHWINFICLFFITAWPQKEIRNAWRCYHIFRCMVLWNKETVTESVKQVSASNWAHSQPLQHNFHFNRKVLLSQLFYFLCLPLPSSLLLLPAPPSTFPELF